MKWTLFNFSDFDGLSKFYGFNGVHRYGRGMSETKGSVIIRRKSLKGNLVSRMNVMEAFDCPEADRLAAIASGR